MHRMPMVSAEEHHAKMAKKDAKIGRLVEECAQWRFMARRLGPREWSDLPEDARELWRADVRRDVSKGE